MQFQQGGWPRGLQSAARTSPVRQSAAAMAPIIKEQSDFRLAPFEVVSSNQTHERAVWQWRVANREFCRASLRGEAIMALNLTQIVSQLLTPQVVARIAGALGINPALAQTLINAAIPAVLASLGGVAATPTGAQRISDQVGAQDPDVLDKLVAGISGGNQASILSSGTQALAGLLGGGEGVSALTGALSK